MISLIRPIDNRCRRGIQLLNRKGSKSESCKRLLKAIVLRYVIEDVQNLLRCRDKVRQKVYHQENELLSY